MSISLTKVLQRVRLLDHDGIECSRRRTEPVLSILSVLSDAALDDELERPVHLFVAEIARRARKGVRATQNALRAAAQFGLIFRVPDHGGYGAVRPWAVLLHRDLIEASREAKPWAGDPIQFPRSWSGSAKDDQTAAALLHEVHRMQVHRVQGKREFKHGPRAPVSGKASARRDGAACPPPGGRGGVGDDHGTLQGEIEMSPTEVSQDEVDAGHEQFWSWLSASCELAHWVGQVRLFGQRRRQDGERGGPFQLASAQLQQAAGAAARAQRLAIGRGDAEITFQAVDSINPLLLIDDLDSRGVVDADRLFDGVLAVVETSPGCHQATVVAPRALSARERVSIQRALALRLGGDTGALSSSQLRRPPGSRNRKPMLAEPFVARLVNAPVVGGMTDKLLSQLIAEGGAAPGEATAIVGDDVCPKDARALGADPSRTDYGWTINQLTRIGGLRGDALVNALAAASAARDKHKADPGACHAYAQRTVRAAKAELSRRLVSRTSKAGLA